jgi:hypothetical protein
MFNLFWMGLGPARLTLTDNTLGCTTAAYTR